MARRLGVLVVAALSALVPIACNLNPKGEDPSARGANAGPYSPDAGDVAGGGASSTGGKASTGGGPFSYGGSAASGGAATAGAGGFGGYIPPPMGGAGNTQSAGGAVGAGGAPPGAGGSPASGGTASGAGGSTTSGDAGVPPDAGPVHDGAVADALPDAVGDSAPGSDGRAGD